MSSQPRKTRQDGIRTVDDLKMRCRINDETKCWEWPGAAHRGSPRVWLPGLGAQSITFAVQWLQHGTKPTSARMLVPTCGDAACANPAHRRWGTRGDLFRLIRPTLPADHRARIGAAKRRLSATYSPEIHREIMSGGESCSSVGARIGMHYTHVARIRRGEAWASSSCASSVFSWRPA